MAGRTLLQQAVPITFGLKAARWLALLTRLVSRLNALRESGLAAEASEWLAEHRVLAVGSDNVAWDLPGYVDERLGLTLPGHVILLPVAQDPGRDSQPRPPAGIASRSLVAYAALPSGPPIRLRPCGLG